MEAYVIAAICAVVGVSALGCALGYVLVRVSLAVFEAVRRRARA